MRAWGALLGAVALVGGLATSSATASIVTEDALDAKVVADTDRVTIREFEGWVTYEYKDDLPRSEQRVHQGKRDGEGCVFSGSRTMSGSEDAISEEREVGYHRGDCLLVTEVGEREVGEVDAAERSDGLTAEDEAKPVVIGMLKVSLPERHDRRGTGQDISTRLASR